VVGKKHFTFPVMASTTAASAKKVIEDNVSCGVCFEKDSSLGRLKCCQFVICIPCGERISPFKCPQCRVLFRGGFCAEKNFLMTEADVEAQFELACRLSLEESERKSRLDDLDLQLALARSEVSWQEENADLEYDESTQAKGAKLKKKKNTVVKKERVSVPDSEFTGFKLIRTRGGKAAAKMSVGGPNGKKMEVDVSLKAAISLSLNPGKCVKRERDDQYKGCCDGSANGAGSSSCKCSHKKKKTV
jgi:hypothetical protein